MNVTDWALAVARAAPRDANGLAEVPPDSVGGFVYEGGPMSLTDIRTRGILENVKSVMHGHRKAFVVAPDVCLACGLCVKACPETAITLVANGVVS